MIQDNFQNDLMRKKCSQCNFEFFTHYKTKVICESCESKNENTTTVRNWEK